MALLLFIYSFKLWSCLRLLPIGNYKVVVTLAARRSRKPGSR